MSVDDYLNIHEIDSKPSADTVIDEETGVMEQPEALEGGAASQPLTAPQSLDETATLMDMRETAQAMGIAWYADGDIRAFEQYKYEPWQKKLLIEAWAPLVAQAGLKIGVGPKILYAEAMSSGPLIAMMIKNRKHRKELEAARELIASQNARIAALEGRQSDEPSAGPSGQAAQQRPDTKKGWQIKDDGTFYFDSSGVYAKKTGPQERPSLNPESYRLLVKHNGKEKVDRIFKIPAA